MTVQYDLFDQPLSDLDILNLKKEHDHTREQLGNVRRGVYSRLADVQKELMKLKEEMESMRDDG